MPPKFQSTFIPKGPTTTDFKTPLSRPSSGSRDIVSLIATTIFVISVIMGLVVFGYKYYLNYSIEQKGIELETARATLAPETVTELVRLNSRILSTEKLLNQHRIVSPIFDFLEVSTPKSVRYTDFAFTDGEKGLKLNIRGQASSYTALAQLSQTLNKDGSLKNAVFSDLRLDEKGNVNFAVDADVGEDLVSYKKAIDRVGVPAPAVAPVSTTTATTTPAN